ncbi:MAG: hypothetical protein AAB400_03680, partial [Patescibacteria group bacterium]
MFERTKNNFYNTCTSFCTTAKRSVHLFKKLYALELTVLLIVAGTISITVALYAAPNQAFVYQGKLTDQNYTPVSNGTYYAKLKVYSDPAGGNANCVWATGSVTNATLSTITNNCTEALTTSAIQVTVSHGAFAIHIGDTSLTGGKMPDISSLNFKTTTYYLGVTVCGTGADAATACGTDPAPAEMTPLLAVTGSPAAASIISTLQANTFNQVPGSYTQINDADGITTSDATITVDSTAGYPSAGTILIDTEVMTYTATTATTLTGVVRGALGTTAATHADNATVKTYLFSGAAGNTTLINDADGITAADTTITVDSTAGYPTSGAIRIDNELITYTGISAPTFTGAVRGARGTTAATHTDNAIVKLDIFPTYFITSDGSAFVNANSSPFMPSQIALQINNTTSYAFGNDQLGNNYFNIRGGNLDDFSIPTFYRIRHETSVSGSYSAHQLFGRNAALTSANSTNYTTLSVSPPIQTSLTGSTQVTTQMDSVLFNRPRIASITEGITDAATFSIAGPPSLSANVATNMYAFYINGAEVTEGIVTPSNAYGLSIAAPTGATNNYAAAFTGGKVGVGTVSPITQLHVAGSVPSAALNGSGTAAGAGTLWVTVQGRYAYVTNNTANTLQIFDVSNPASPLSVGIVATQTNPVQVVVKGRYAYVANTGSNTLQVFDVSNPASPTSAGTVATGNGPAGVAVQGKFAYVLNFSGDTFQVFDVSNPASPTAAEIAPLATGTSPLGIEIRGRYAYITNNGTTDSFQIIDVSDPTQATVRSTTTTGAGTDPSGVALQGRYAYITLRGTDTLQIFDISNPASPTSVGTVAT